jgi:plastocyanin
MSSVIKRNALLALAAAVLAAAVAVPVASGAGSKHKQTVKKVAVADNFFAPTKLTIKKGNAINFVWKKTNFNSHNVTLVKGPKSVRHSKFTSVTGATGMHFKRTFTTTGTYHFECTIHPETMNLTVIVKK